MLVAVPSKSPGGLDATIADHFGHCDAFTLVQIDNDQVGEATVLQNPGHGEQGCMGPVMLLKNKGAEALVAGGMGARPLGGFQQEGITVFHKGEATTVREAVEGIIAGTSKPFAQQHTCGGGGHEGGCGGHHHDHDHGPKVQFERVDDPVEPGSMARISYELFDAEGRKLDSSEARYIHGQGQIAPGLERAVAGHTAGQSFEVTVSPEDGFGERDDERVVQVPVDQLPKGIEVGTTLQARLPTGQMIPITLVSIDGDQATVDHNHPLAGKTLLFKVKVIEVMGQVPEEPAEG
jgi:FKBP-type peptidyl-prolyl cis-trans isomerase 2/predicted Fe-Mo cluster-binding NifX family protein